MEPVQGTGIFRTEINAYFGFIGFAMLVYGYLLQRWSRPWIISDWLINYQADFVRRGLPGELIYRLSRLHLSPVWMVVGFTLLLYGMLLLELSPATPGSERYGRTRSC